MIDSGLYNYVNVLDKAADASWLRQSTISNNIANQDTPGFKRSDVDFQSALEMELRHFKYEPLDERVGKLHLEHLDVQPMLDSAGFSYRIDDNNVDPEQEYVNLAETQITYNGLIDSINKHFSQIKSVIK